MKRQEEDVVQTRRSIPWSQTPGVLVIAIAVAAAYSLSLAWPTLGALTTAVFLGVAARNMGLLNARSLATTSLLTKKLLRVGVALLGLQLAIGQILDLHPGVGLMILATVALTFGGTLLLGRLIGTKPGTTLLVATGFSICGASAVVAMDAVSESDEEDVATAVALVTLFGSIAIVVLPLLKGPLQLSDFEFGLWSGASVHEVAQVVATASAAGPAALAVATVVKLTRVVVLAPLIAGASLVRRQTAIHSGTERARPPIVPLFVVGFLAMMCVRSVGVLPIPTIEVAKVITTLLLAGALFGLGTAVNVPALIRTGGRALLLGAASSTIAAITSLAGIYLLP